MSAPAVSVPCVDPVGADDEHERGADAGQQLHEREVRRR